MKKQRNGFVKALVEIMTYEGIVQQVFDYDYAPASMSVENRRKYFNMSQEGGAMLIFYAKRN